LISKDRATPIGRKITVNFSGLRAGQEVGRVARQAPFLPGGKFCRLQTRKSGAR
jgi:hypothetical protein